MKITFQTLHAAIRGQWPALLLRLGIAPEHLRNQHGPCPGCGGTDRFRFDDRNGSGSFYCSGGGAPVAGDGFALLAHVHNWSPRECLEAVAAALGAELTPPAQNAHNPHNAEPDPAAREAKRERLRRRFQQARPITPTSPAGGYLAARGFDLPAYPATLRAAVLTYWAPATPPRNLGEHPAMLAAIQDPDGALVGLHRTYLDGCQQLRLRHPDSGAPLPAKKMQAAWRGATRGGAIRLHPAAERLVVAEGIETSLAAHLASGRPAWAALSAGGLAALCLPDEVQDVLIAADADETGQKAARTLAARLLREGRTARLATPPAGDWADVLKEAAHG